MTSNIMHNVNSAFQKITFGMGCFWANDALFGGTPGVLRTRVGYSGGTLLNPTYRNLGDHTEVVEVDYDPEKVTFKALLDQFWQHHEYGITTKIKVQYASRIFYHNEEQKKISEEALKVESAKYPQGKLQTQIYPVGIFYPAEDYHQKYRLQRYQWICEALNLTPELLQTSHIAARLNGYLTGVGKQEEVLKMRELGVPEKVAAFVQEQFEDNKGGNLYC